MKTLYLREWGRVVCSDDTEQRSADVIALNHQAWSFLAKIAESSDKTHRYLRFVKPTVLQVRNFVGVISTPDGTQIEILQKTTEAEPEIAKTRALLLNMLRSVDNVWPLQATDAKLEIEKKPLPEALIALFLRALKQVVRKGIRKDYERISAEERFLKGQLQVAKQLRQPLARQHLFQIEYDLFSENRAENRLIHAALVVVSRYSQQLDNQRLARELRFAFDEVPQSQDYLKDFGLWRTSRDMVYYQSLLPWLKLILNQYSPFAVKGEQAGISFLFPMEKVFESYVAKQLQLALPNGYSLRTQLSHVHLAHQSTTQQKAFLLKPDLAIYYGQECVAILDTKWKLVDANLTYDNGNPDPKAGISQADMYQLYAYGHKYLNGVGRLFLIYPQWAQFNANKPVPSFEFNDDLTLDVLPFDLESGRLEINLAVNGFGQLAD